MDLRVLQGCHDWPLSRVIEVRYPEVYSVSDKVPGYHPRSSRPSHIRQVYAVILVVVSFEILQVKNTRPPAVEWS